MRPRIRALSVATLIGVLLASHPLGAQDDPFAELEKETASKQGSSSKRTTAEDYRALRARQRAAYDAYRKKLAEAYQQYRQIVREENARFQSRAEEEWDDPTTSTDTEWIEYANDMKERRTVDFEKETIQIETEVGPNDELDEKAVRETLKEIVSKNRAQAFADDPVLSNVDERSRQEVDPEVLETAPVKPEPLITAYLTGEAKSDDALVDAIVDHMMEDLDRSVAEDSRGRMIETVVVPLSAPESVLREAPAAPSGKGRQAPEKLPRKATNVWPHVDGSSNDAKIPPALVLAVIETESAFNPQAMSPTPAYGLMQIVPTSAGLDATEKLFGKPRLLAPSYLYDSGNNIEIGSIYLNLLLYRYLRGIDDPLSRLYCSVAAYNTGAGNVARAFTGSKILRKAFPKINAMTPQEVYDHLIENLPYEETRKYLERVSRRIQKYEQLGA